MTNKYWAGMSDDRSYRDVIQATILIYALW
jgi:hypothetical protein